MLEPINSRNLISMDCAFPSQSRCKNLIRIDLVSHKSFKSPVDRGAFSSKVGNFLVLSVGVQRLQDYSYLFSLSF